MRALVIVLVLLGSGCSSAGELQSICNRTHLANDPALAKYDPRDRYTIYFDRLGKTAHDPEVRRTFRSMSQSNPLDRPVMLRNMVKVSKLARCPLLDQIDAFYLGDPITGCAPFDPDTCHPKKVDAGFLAAWAKLPAAPQRGLELERVGEADLQNLGKLSNLKRLDVQLAPGLTDIDALGRLTALTELNLHNSDITSVEPLGQLSNLEKLSLSQDAKLTSLAGLEKLKKLRDLDVNGTAVIDLAPLKSLGQLKELEVRKVSSEQVAMLKQANPALRIVQDD